MMFRLSLLIMLLILFSIARSLIRRNCPEASLSGNRNQITVSMLCTRLVSIRGLKGIWKEFLLCFSVFLVNFGVLRPVR